ncbi:non-oxidative hydroxyarylic acid decarboxylases subunit C [Pseudonocardia sp. KRD291]|uniref:non-oxidative hydroxyarylic acid decarboxylases subunit C n=1 Tax=Pseudonocardia sp. KRD291 TaxID=2792007 RepID=UPI001C49E244|nr:non-oxidative hydroxyarylic acid decarboxylases subunit C [Pseudonocardia sp. KRD291]MBW0103025.1 UbiD family decarboxylase [Pseudonocardia sp. KRD291]
MPADDLREFLADLDRHGQLVTVTDQVRTEPDLGAAAAAAPKLGDNGPALLFTDVEGFRDPRIVLNAHGSWANHAIALGMPPQTPVREQVEEFSRRWAAFPVPPERRADPPFARNQVTGDDVALFDLLPLFRLNEGDGGFYLDKAAIISRDPDDPESSGKQNVGTYRLQCRDQRHLGIQPVPQHDVAVHLRTAEERGEDLPVAIALGNEPTIPIVAGMPLAYDRSEYEMAGALRGSPCPIATGPETGLDVPWGTEVLIEGVVLGGTREFEGPFGEFTGAYSGGRSMPVIRIDRISYRDDPYFEHLYLGMPWTEVDYLIGPTTCVPLLEQLRAEFPEVVAVNAMYTHGMAVVVSVRNRFGGFGKAVGTRVMSTPHGLGYCKIVIVVDETVDPFDMAQVMWAISTKVHPAHDLVTLPNMSIMPLDAGAQPRGISHKLVIDATAPAPPETRGDHGHGVTPPPETADWVGRLTRLVRRTRSEGVS